ncbi:hypothetical protein [Hymenobacter sp. BT491]|uniref:hypothetical protein n=1 Tax=Hymenobacter sp. BT491 TaxID=2766779 RepID=UPI001653BC8D|nr:hypothetical protein [Hymenobacter sp. BT491]MBC6988912.1 hypothetical protein [Hymenobacter sp. BT491]
MAYAKVQPHGFFAPFRYCVECSTPFVVQPVVHCLCEGCRGQLCQRSMQQVDRHRTFLFTYPRSNSSRL